MFDAVALGARPAFIWWLLVGLTVAVHYEVLFSGKHLRIYRRVSVDRLAERESQARITTPSGLKESA